MPRLYPCTYCDEFHGPTLKKLLSHIKFYHSHEPNFKISCSDCGQSFRKFSSFKTHKRREELKRVREKQADCTLIEDREGSGEDEEFEDIEDNDLSVQNMTRFLALFILKVKEINQLNHETMNCILDNTDEIINSSLETLKRKITRCLNENDIDVRNIDGFEDILKDTSDYSKAKDALDSEYLQMRYFVENFNYVEPEEVVLSQWIEHKIVNGRNKAMMKKETFHYIPILKTVEALLNHPEVLSEVCNSHASTDSMMRDFCDGSDFKNHDLFSNNPGALILHCYYDDFQVTNPLGSKTKKHKIGAFYFVIGNLRPCFRSVINTIQLFALCRTPLIEKYGIDRILQPFVQDVALMESENGVQLKIEQHWRTFRGSIGPFTADNLGAHSLGGFIGSFNSLRVCRFCMGTKEDIQTKFSEDQFVLRTKDMYNRHAHLVHQDPTLATTYGIKRKSILNELSYFNVVEGLDADIMHDQLEGVLPLQVKLMLKLFIHKDKYFTLEVVNSRIEKFNYGFSDSSNKPSPVKQQALAAGNDSASLSQTAAQMWCLSRLLPLLIGDLVPEHDECWQNFLRLLKIEELVFSPVTSTCLAAFLQVLIEEYLLEFRRIHPDRQMIPKQHYMVHYPRFLVRRGPLVRNWSIRFEAKHNYFKRLVGKINNFKNITYSLAKRHQLLQSYLLQSSAGNFLHIYLEIGPGHKSALDQDAGLFDALRIMVPGITCKSTVLRTSWIKVYGTKYKRGCIVVLSLQHGDPVFGKVNEVMLVDGKHIIFKCTILHNQGFEEHLNAYKVIVDGGNETYVDHSSLLDFHPLDLLKGCGDNANTDFCVLRYRVDCLV